MGRFFSFAMVRKASQKRSSSETLVRWPRSVKERFWGRRLIDHADAGQAANFQPGGVSLKRSFPP